jgi:hypothetical protein
MIGAAEKSHDRKTGVPARTAIRRSEAIIESGSNREDDK